MSDPAPNSLSSQIVLRDVIEDDLPIFFEHQLDPEACQMAAFPSRDRDTFMAHWHKILGNDTLLKQTILFAGAVVGNIVSWEQDDQHEVGYWIGRQYWGKGVASAALTAFLDYVKPRPLYAHVVKHNVASLRVLQKCGFTISGEATGDDGVEECMLRLDAQTP